MRNTIEAPPPSTVVISISSPGENRNLAGDDCSDQKGTVQQGKRRLRVVQVLHKSDFVLKCNLVSGRCGCTKRRVCVCVCKYLYNRTEVSVLSKLRHPNIITYMGYYLEDPYIHIVMEYMER